MEYFGTLGPSCAEENTLRKMIQAGMTGLRINLSHGGLNSRREWIRAAQAAAQADLLQQRTALGQQYQAAIEQALAENNYEMANALYQEAVRAEEALQEQMQFNANLALQYAKLAASMAKKS